MLNEEALRSGVSACHRESLDRLLRIAPFFAHCLQVLPLDAQLRLIEEARCPQKEDAPQLSSSLSFQEAQKRLRIAARASLARAIWWELGLRASIEASWRGLSAFADRLVDAALAYAVRISGVENQGARLCVFALGKLGGEELNLGSDLDLVILWDGDRALSDSVRRAAQLFVRLLDEPTADGRAWRVDLRLRPGGDAAPLAVGLAAWQNHLLYNAQFWERAAWLKARFVAGDRALAARVEQDRQAFVYRPRLDGAALEGLAELKRRIDAAAGRKGFGPGWDIKRGCGGIREIEFVAQALQLAYGGRRPKLQRRATLPALKALAEEGILPRKDADLLAEAYRQLRRLEHAVQARRGEHTHRLPPDALPYLDEALGCGSYERAARLAAQVQRIFGATVAWAKQTVRTDWLGHAPWPQHWDAKQRKAYADALLAVRDEIARPGWPERAREYLRAFLDEAMPAWLADANGAQALGRLAVLLRAMRGRVGWLDLLARHEGARRWLIGVLAAGRWVADRVARDPAWLEWPLSAEGGLGDAERLCAAIERMAPRPEEEARRALAQMSAHARMTLALAADAHHAPIEALAAAWSRLADAAVRAARRLALDQMGLAEDFGLVVLALGKQGSREMTPHSDLDLVLVYLGEDREGLELAQRAGRRMLGILTASAPFGAGFAIDARLRPSGHAGVLVTSLAGFARYQQEEAQLWEHQALSRARAVAGEDRDRAQLMRCVNQALMRWHGRGREVVMGVCAMKKKIEAHHGGRPDAIDLKHDPGGMVDVEFAAQAARLVLGLSGTGTIELLRQCRQKGIAAAEGLEAAYRRWLGAAWMLAVELDAGIARIPLAPDAPAWGTLARHLGIASSEALRAEMRKVREAFFTFLSDLAGLPPSAIVF